MQIFKANQVRASEASPKASEQEELANLESAIEESASGFFGEDTPVEAPPLPASPFDLLFDGAPAAPGSRGQNPSIDQWNLPEVPKAEDLLVDLAGKGINPATAIPDLIKKYAEAKSRLVRKKEVLEKQLKAGGMKANEKRVILEVIEKYEKVILESGQNIAKLERMQEQNEEAYHQERVMMKDLNADRYIGDPSDEENSYIVGRLPNGREVLLDPETKEPVSDPYLNPNYLPALFSTDNLSLLGEEVSSYDARLRLRSDFDGSEAMESSTLGAQIDMSVPEFIWVKRGEDGKGEMEFSPGVGTRYVLPETPLEIVQREDGKEMIGQKVPAMEERDKYIAVRVGKVEVRSEYIEERDVNGNAIQRSFVYITLRDNSSEEKAIMTIRVEGYEIPKGETMPANAMALLGNGNYYVSPGTVGVALNNGFGKDSTRIRPVAIDAGGLESHGRILRERGALLDELGIAESELKTLPYGKEGPENEKIKNEALQFTLDTILGSEEGSQSKATKNAVLNAIDRVVSIMSIGEIKQRMIEALSGPPFNGPIAKPLMDVTLISAIRRSGNTTESLRATINGIDRFMNSHGIEGLLRALSIDGNALESLIWRTLYRSIQKPSSKRQEYLDPDEANKDQKFGIGIVGLRGAFTGTDYNDIAVIPPPNEEHLREFLAENAEEVQPDMPAYGVYFDGKNGKNTVISHGGDLFAKGVTFLWREKDPATKDRQDQLYIETTNNIDGLPIKKGEESDKIFVHIGDQNPERVVINNGQDQNEQHIEGDEDDWYDAPKHYTIFGHVQNDVPQDQVEAGVGADLRSIFSDRYETILKEAIRQDPLSKVNWEGFTSEFGAHYTEWEEVSNSFFDEWGYFKNETTGETTEEEA